jgi:hypothetical protein
MFKEDNFCFKGCLNDRDDQLKKLYRQIALNKKVNKMETAN